MNKPATGHWRRFTTMTTVQAMVCGAALGMLVWLMADLRQGNVVSQAMAMLLVLAAPVSFLCLALGRHKQRSGSERLHALRGWVCWLGVGLLATLHGLNLLVYSQ